MIYLFNESKTLFSIVSREELLSFLYEREVNALYQASVEMPVQSTDKNGLTRNLYNEMQNATYFGHYDLNDKFQLHKIVSIDVTGDSFITTAVHLFFDEAKALAVTEERRFIDRPIEDSVIYAFGLIGWTLDEFDVSDAKTVSFFNDTVLEAQAKIIKTFGFKFDYWLDFDGQKITSKKVKVKEELGTQTHQRYVYGHNTLGIKMETDFSEIYTAVLGRGHGERIENLDDEGNETEDTFGRRIEFDEVEWSKSSGDPLDKDLGDRILVDPDSTQIFGYVREDDTVAPRVKVVEFSDIEDKEELLQASYEWLMENNSPKAVYSVEVLETEELDLGDEVYVVYRDIDFVKSARVSRVVDDLLTDRRAVEFGDSDYFRRNSETSRLQRELQDTKNDSADYIQDLKRQANARIDAEMQQARDDFEQALIVAQAEIEAIDERMSTEIANEIESFETEFNLEVQAAKDFAEQKALEHSDVVRGELNTFASVHSQLVQDLESDVMNIDDFLGSARDITLDERLQNINLDFNERIDNINVNTRNMFRGTRFDEDQFTLVGGAQIHTDESIYYADIGNVPGHRYPQMETEINIVEGQRYKFSADIRTNDLDGLGYFVIWAGDDFYRVRDSNGEEGFPNLIQDGLWHRYTFEFVAEQSITGTLLFRTRFNNGSGHIRLMYLTQSNNTEWLPHPLDNTQSIEEVTRRITELEDGRQTLITRSEYDFDTGKVNQTIAGINETVDTNSVMIANIEDYDVIKNGSLVMQTVNGFEQKVWDTTEEIQANLIPQSANAWVDGRYWSGGSLAAGGQHANHISLERSLAMQTGSQVAVTMSDESSESSGIDYWAVYFTNHNGTIFSGENAITVSRGQTRTFTVPAGSTRVLVSAISDGTNINPSWIEQPNRRINVKLEVGSNATPMLNAISHIEQLANSVSIAVQEIDGSGLVRQSDINVSPSSVRIGSTEILGDDVLSSVLNVSPSAIDMITQKMRLSGDLYVDGDITSLAVTAIEGNFARLFASEIETVDLNADNIKTGTLSSERLRVDNALIDRLLARSILTEEISSLSLTAVYGDIAELRTTMITSDVIESDHINVNNALIDKLFAREALIERLTSKTAFISQLRSNIIDANTIRVGFNDISNNVTITPNGIDISEGALTIRRPDGAVWIQNGMPRNQFNAQVNQFITTGTDATWTGSAYRTSARSLVQVANIYTVHEGRYLDVHIATNMTSASSSSSAYIRVRVEGFGYTGASNDAKTEGYFSTRGASDDTHSTITIDLGVPTYNLRQFYVSFGFSSDTSDNNFATMRIKRATVRG